MIYQVVNNKGKVDVTISVSEKINFNAQSIKVREEGTLHSGKRNNFSGNCNDSKLWYL